MTPNEAKPRGMKAGEIAMASRVFGNALSYGLITLYEGDRELGRERQAAMYASGGDIYDPRGLKSNYALATRPWDRFAFIHELTHVWQYQSGVKFNPTTVYRTGMLEDSLAHNEKYLRASENWSDDHDWVRDMVRRRNTEIRSRLEDQKQLLDIPIPLAAVDPFVTPSRSAISISGKLPGGGSFSHELCPAERSRRRSEVIWDEWDDAKQVYDDRAHMVSYWQDRERFEYNYVTDDLPDITFYDLNVEQQAQIAGEYYLMLEGYTDPRPTLVYATGGRKRPSLSFYKNFIPFAKLGTGY